MAGDLNDITVRMALLDDISRGLARIQGELAAVKAEAHGIGGASVQAGLAGTTSRVSEMDRAGQGLHQNLIGISGTLTGLVGTTTKWTSIGLGAITLGVGAFGLKASASFEMSRIAFGALVGDVAKGNQLFDQLQAYNLTTPFQLPQLTAATQTLLQFGYTAETVVKTVKNIGDVASLTANPSENLQRMALAIGQIRGSGTLRAQDLNQLVQAGFPAYQLIGQIYGKSSAELRKQMQSGASLPSDTFLKAVDQMQGPLQRYVGGAIKAGHTLQGEWSNVVDALRMESAKAFEPLAKQLQKDLPGYTKQLGGLVDAIAPDAATIIGDLIHLAAIGLPPIAHATGIILHDIDTLAHKAGPGLKQLAPVGHELSQGLGRFVQQIGPEMPKIAEAGVSLLGILPTMLQLLGDLVILVSPIATLVSELLKFGPVRDVVAGLLVALLGYKALSGVVGAITSMSSALWGLAGAEEAAAVAGTGAGVGGVGGVGRAGKLSKGAKIGGALVGGSLIVGGQSGHGAGAALETVAGGALTGAAIGSVIPGVGTVAGGVVGGAAAGGWELGKWLFSSGGGGGGGQNEADKATAYQRAFQQAVAGGANPQQWIAAHPGSGQYIHFDSSINGGVHVQVVQPKSDADISSAVTHGIRAKQQADYERDVPGASPVK